MHLNVDSDSLCYAAGFVCNGPDQESLACWQLGESVKRILQDTACDSYTLYLTGKNNFRYALYPEYKANRVSAKPIHLQAMRSYLVEQWGAVVTDTIEADDAVGIAQCEYKGRFGEAEPAIAGIDKDLLTIPGNHYNFRKKEWKFQSELDATRWLYTQMILGDKADNIPGFDGMMRPKAPKKLQWAIDELEVCENEAEMFEHVFNMYNKDVAKFSTSMHCLYLQKKENDEWSCPVPGLSGFTQKDVMERLKNEQE